MTAGRKSRDKGARGEVEIVKLLKECGWPARRNFASGGQGGSDIVGGPAGTCIEVKWQEHISIWACLAQCEAAAGPSELPVLAFRRNHSGWYAAIPLDALWTLLADRDMPQRAAGDPEGIRAAR